MIAINCKMQEQHMSSPMEQPHAHLSLEHYRIFGRVHVVLLAADIPTDHPESNYAYFDISECKSHRQQEIEHTAQPLSILMLHNFAQKLDELIQCNPHRSTALRVAPNVEAETIAALLLGTYMVMRLDLSPDDAMKRLEVMNITSLSDDLLQGNCQVMSSGTKDEISMKSAAYPKGSCSQRQLLRVKDCLEAMKLAQNLRWINLSSQQRNDKEQGPFLGFDAEDYEFLSNPFNADITEVSELTMKHELVKL
jgi:hypothetical protein